MTSLGVFAILLTLAAVFGLVNARTLRLPSPSACWSYVTQ
jgi:hypothetical protein